MSLVMTSQIAEDIEALLEYATSPASTEVADRLASVVANYRSAQRPKPFPVDKVRRTSCHHFDAATMSHCPTAGLDTLDKRKAHYKEAHGG